VKVGIKGKVERREERIENGARGRREWVTFLCRGATTSCASVEVMSSLGIILAIVYILEYCPFFCILMYHREWVPEAHRSHRARSLTS
jgi:hypothetical protein